VMKIMIIEDDLTAQSLLTTLLRFEGYEILLPQFGSEQIILEDVARLQPDLILMDVHLRRMNGLDILQEIRSNAKLNSMKIVITSGEDYSYECRRNGADGFLMKPYMPDDLTHLINRLLLS
jgi:DNA-binding response OmpR family regulator